MSKLKLNDIKKSYKAGNTTVEALKGVSLEFRESEFVSILGPSGCGKTTLLNIVGGLDRYDKGDLIINDMSTKSYKDKDWDAYRNRSIGFVFQNYNLISHQTVLQNVEIAMTLSGVPLAERKRRAKEALIAVHLEDQMKKKPNQLSGGQMQRVAIARALVNNPDIILADEPTGALDSHTSVRIMEILKEVSKTRLVIMVTHNAEMADEYSSRVIRLLDGEVQEDSNPVIEEKTKAQEIVNTKKVKLKKTSMSLSTATSLSFKNLLTKKGRTIITALAGSIGIIGVALVLALSNGLTGYIGNMQSEALSGFPISISTGEQSIDFNERPHMGNDKDETGFEKFTSDDVIYRYDSSSNTTRHTNILTPDYLNYISELEAKLPNAINTISYARGVDINLLAKGESSVVKYATSTASFGNMPQMINSSYWQEMPDNSEFILSLYDLVGDGSRLPETMNEVVLVVDEYNRIDEALFQKLGIFTQSDEYKITDFIGKTMLKVIPNNNFYTKDINGNFIPANSTEYDKLYNNNEGLNLTITGVLRLKDGAASSYLSPGIIYTTSLTDYIVEDAQKSEIAIEQAKVEHDVILNIPFADAKAKEQRMISLGAITTPTSINIYPKDFASKDNIKEYLDKYNAGKATEDQIIYSDLAEMITSMIGTLINTISYVLIGFAAISLLVSTIMIGIITYVSVIERTKEIGILRSVGARKKDISRVFNAETLIIGFAAGILGVGISYLLTLPINSVIENLVDIKGIADLSILSAFVLILGSMGLTFIAGLFPSRMAAKKDPVVALRTE
ncbi:MAG: putative transporter ATP-binding/permease protein [Clostridiales bacterium]|jgi:putative ABC transport system permease protein|nr:putative transporter ATP-binding/permease protein [Clostridiales bacterium]